MIDVLTPYKKKKQQRNKSVAADYKKMTRVKGAMSSKVIDILTEKYGLVEKVSIYRILKKENVQLKGRNN